MSIVHNSECRPLLIKAAEAEGYLIPTDEDELTRFLSILVLKGVGEAEGIYMKHAAIQNQNFPLAEKTEQH